MNKSKKNTHSRRFNILNYANTVRGLINCIGKGFPSPDKGERGLTVYRGVIINYPELRHVPVIQPGVRPGEELTKYSLKGLTYKK